MNVENINEVARTVFKKDKNHIHIMDVPMFSLYIHKDLLKNTNIANRDFNIMIYSLFAIADKNFPGQLPKDWQPNNPSDTPKDEYLKKVENFLKTIFTKAKNQINDIGFSSAHANVVFNEMEDLGTASYAGFISLNVKYVDTRVQDNPSFISTIVHEWAHLFMFNRSTQFKNAVNSLYKDIPEPQMKSFQPMVAINFLLSNNMLVCIVFYFV